MKPKTICKYLALLSLVGAGFLLFGVQIALAGYIAILTMLVFAAFADKTLYRDLTLVALGLLIVSFSDINTDISYSHMLLMGMTMGLAVALPYLISRYVHKSYLIRFPFHFRQAWPRWQWWYLGLVVLVGYLAIPYYMISTGVYENWPSATNPSDIFRLFVGTNALGIWDELFFICVVLTILMRHFPFWIANLAQAVLFTSFLYDLGFTAWGPALIYTFALIQGYLFKLSHSLSYIITIHLLFDFILFLVLIHAHTPAWIDIFLV